MALWTRELECFHYSKVYEREKEVVDSEILDSYGRHEEPSGGPVGDYMPRSELKKLIEENIKNAVEVAEKMIEDAFTVGLEEQNEGIKTTFRNIVEGASIEIVEQGRLENQLSAQWWKVGQVHLIYRFSGVMCCTKYALYHANHSVC